MDKRFIEAARADDQRFARVNVLLGVILVALVVPLLQTLIDWMGSSGL